MTNQPTQAHIQEFGLQPYQYGDQTVWIMPNTQPATWAEVSGFNEVLHFAVFHSMPERVWLQWASGEPGCCTWLSRSGDACARLCKPGPLCGLQTLAGGSY